MPLFQGGGGMNAALSSAPTSWHTCHLAHAQNGLCRWNGSGTDSVYPKAVSFASESLKIDKFPSLVFSF